jgi:hypothetical protein
MPLLGLIVVCAVVALSLPLIREQYNEWFVFPPLREYVTKHLLDPRSAQYRNEFLSHRGVLCGELNSKNSSGGYVGFRRYISDEHHQYLQELGILRRADWSHAEVMASLESQSEVMEEALALRKADPNFKIPSKDTLRELANARLFDKMWKTLCLNQGIS